MSSVSAQASSRGRRTGRPPELHSGVLDAPPSSVIKTRYPLPNDGSFHCGLVRNGPSHCERGLSLGFLAKIDAFSKVHPQHYPDPSRCPVGSGDSSEAARRSQIRLWSAQRKEPAGRHAGVQRHLEKHGPDAVSDTSGVLGLGEGAPSSLVQWAGRPAVCSRLAGFQLGRAVLPGQPARLPDLQGKALAVGDTGPLGAGYVCLLAGQLANETHRNPRGRGWRVPPHPLLPAPPLLSPVLLAPGSRAGFTKLLQAVCPQSLPFPLGAVLSGPGLGPA